MRFLADTGVSMRWVERLPNGVILLTVFAGVC